MNTAGAPKVSDTLRSVLLVAALLALHHSGLNATALTEHFLAIQINGQDSGLNAIVRRGPDQSVWMQIGDLQSLRLQFDAATPVGVDGWVDLRDIAGLEYRVVEATQTLQIESDATNFEATRMSMQRVGVATPTPSQPGAFLNYDFSVAHNGGDTRVDGVMELGAFAASGVLVSNAVVRDLGNQSEWVRLDTTWSRDDPANRSTLRLGDALSSTVNWSSSVRFFGAQWATNYATQPEFAPYPMQAIEGEAVLPSIVEIYLNDALRLRSEVPPGPFSIRDLPTVSGSGTTRVVVRDLLGREQVYSQPFYGSTRLLRAGLSDYSFEFGVVRENYGLRSNDYGRGLAVGTYRRGLSDALTWTSHAQLTADQQTVGTGVTWTPGSLGVANLALAASHSERGQGRLLNLGYQYLGRRWSMGLNSIWTSADFSLLGQARNAAAPRRRAQAFASVAMRSGSLGLNYTVQDFRDRADSELLSLSYGSSIGGWGYLNLNVLHFLGDDSDTALTLSFTRAIGDRSSASSIYNWREDSRGGSLVLQRSVPLGTGMGYRLRADLGDAARYNGALLAQSDYGSYALEVARASGSTATRLGVNGGMALLGGDLHFSRRLDTSFAVVEVGGFEEVRIYADNQLVGRSNADGKLMVPRLRAYERNQLRLEQADLPLTAVVEKLELEAIPYFRSGLTVSFPVRRSQTALLQVVLADGTPVPAGAIAHLQASGQAFTVGFRGEIYLTDVADTNVLELSWKDQHCVINVAFPVTDEPMPLLGPYVCNASSR